MSGSRNKRTNDTKNKAGPAPMVMMPYAYTQPATMGYVQAPPAHHAHQGFMQAAPGPNGGAFYMPYHAQQPQQSQQGSNRKRAWAKDEEEDDDDDDEADEEDFKPKKNRRLSLPSKLSANTKKRGEASTSASSHIAMRKVLELPDKFMGRPTVSHHAPNDCVSCGVYLGEIMMLPCGHAKFCTKCMNKLHDNSNQHKRLQLCPVDNCLSSVSGWVRLHHVMK